MAKRPKAGKWAKAHNYVSNILCKRLQKVSKEGELRKPESL